MAYENDERIDLYGDFEIDDSAPCVVLEPGEYDFTVTDIDVFQYEGGKKIPACDALAVKMRCTNDEMGVTGYLTENMYLVKSQAWKITQLLKSVGLIDKDAAKGTKVPLMQMVGECPGKSGRCTVTKHEYFKRDGSKGEANNVGAFLEPEEF